MGGSLRVSFQDGFYGVTSNADLPQPHPYFPLSLSFSSSVHPSLPPLFSLLCTAKWTVIGYSFMRLISALAAPLPTGRGPFCCPLRSECTYVYVVNTPDSRHQVVGGGGCCTSLRLCRHFIHCWLNYSILQLEVNYVLA